MGTYPLEGHRMGFYVRSGKMWFDPRPDITAYELAVCLNIIELADVPVVLWKTLPAEVTRHFSPQ